MIGTLATRNAYGQRERDPLTKALRFFVVGGQLFFPVDRFLKTPIVRSCQRTLNIVRSREFTGFRADSRVA
jgi:hypothetical protein